jgi:hypothetical protein
METVYFVISLLGLFVASFAVLVVAFSIALHGAKWPAWRRYGILVAIFVGYWAFVLSHEDGLTVYRGMAIAAAAASYRVARGFARTFLPSFVAAFNAARNKPR